MRKLFKVENSEAGSHKIDLCNQVFGYLTVIELSGLDKYKNKLWLCKCKCGNTCEVTTTSLKQGRVTSCKCNQYKKGENVHNYTGYKSISRAKWYSIKSNAEIRNLEFNITKQDVWEIFVKQNFRCALTNLKISFEEKTASIDRIINSIGYTKENIWIVHKDINMMRNKFSIEYFKKMCELVIKNNLYE